MDGQRWTAVKRTVSLLTVCRWPSTVNRLMCTVTYISQGKNSFILTSNRDESPNRSPKQISRVQENGLELLFPRDNTAGGTWIAVANSNKVICILNGAYEFHPHQPPYKRSRGVMALDFFQYKNAALFFENYDFEGMEAFTMVTYDNEQLWDVRWDGKKLYTTPLDVNGKYLWASATLYTKEAQHNRKKWFADWQKDRTDFSAASIMRFHRTAGNGDTWNDLIMNRLDMVRTVSITQITKTENNIQMNYNDLLSGGNGIKRLEISSKNIQN